MHIVEIANFPELASAWNTRRKARLRKMAEIMERESGLVTPVQASVLLGVDRKGIRELIKLGELKRYRFLGHAYLSFREVLSRRNKGPDSSEK